MASRFLALTFAAHDPEALADFWGVVLGRKRSADPRDGLALLPGDATGFQIRFVPTDAPKTLQNRAHFDLTSSSLDDQRETVARALAAGGRHVDVGQLPDDGHVVLGDLDGNEFCVIEPGNNFLSGCGLIGAVSGDGSQAAGYFWHRALDWPLVWDQDEETAVQSPAGGTKLTWGGPPLMPKPPVNRLHFDLVPDDGGDPEAEAARLEALGATRADGTGSGGHGPVDGAGRIAMLDPDGNEFCLLAAR